MVRKKKINSSDDQVANELQERLKWDIRINSADFNVEVVRGVVSLTGAVDSTFRKNAIVRIVMSTHGVVGIKDSIDVVSGYSRSDVEIENIVRSQLKPISFADGEWIDVSVRDGIIRLEGFVAWQWHKAIADQIGWSLSGVRDCINLISVGEIRALNELPPSVPTIPQEGFI